MATNTTSPAFLWAREQERKRAEAKRLREQQRIDEVSLLRRLVLRIIQLERSSEAWTQLEMKL
jgi:hypothetical protein